MSDEQRAGGGGADPRVEVYDRRRFTQEGDPVAGPAAAPEAEPGAPEAVGPLCDPRDEVIEMQAARIDELTRSLALLVEEGKAARARLEREKNRVLEAERAEVARTLLEALDGVERALQGAGEVTGALVDGVRLTQSALAKSVSELGAVRISVLGERFDPRVAEAVDLVPVADASQDEVVVQEVRPGYRIGERILRPARVRVGRSTPA
jgi:molecular chaperone GrpE